MSGRCTHETALSLTYLTFARRQHCMGGARMLQNSPGLRPISVLDPLRVRCVVMFPDPPFWDRTIASYDVLRPHYRSRACLALLASLCALPSSLLGADPFLYHPALLEPHRCLLRPRGRVSSHFALVPSNFASGHPFRFQSTLPCASPSLARRNARSD